MKARILIISIFLSLMSSYAATPDSSLFNTEFEHRVFNSLTSSAPIDSIDLFIALSYTSSSKDKVYRFTDALKAKISQYNAKCIIDFFIEDEKEVMHIVITDISEKELKGVMYVGEEYEDSYEVWMIAEDR